MGPTLYVFLVNISLWELLTSTLGAYYVKKQKQKDKKICEKKLKKTTKSTYKTKKKKWHIRQKKTKNLVMKIEMQGILKGTIP